MTSIGLLILLLAVVVSGAIITRDAEKKIKSEKPEVNKPEVTLEKIDPKKEKGKDGQVEENSPTKDEFLSKSESKLKDVKDGAENKLKDDVQEDLFGELKPEVNKPAGFWHGIFRFKKEDGKTEQIEVDLQQIKDESVSNSASQQDDDEIEDNSFVENGKAPAVQILPFFEDARMGKREPQLINGFSQHQQAANGGGGINASNGYFGFGHYNNPPSPQSYVLAPAG